MFDDSLRQTALLLADRDLGWTFCRAALLDGVPSPEDTESKLVAVAWRPDGSLLFSSQPDLRLAFSATRDRRCSASRVALARLHGGAAGPA